MLPAEQYFERAAKKHSNKYDYSKSEFQGVDKKIKIICPIHGEFLQLVVVISYTAVTIADWMRRPKRHGPIQPSLPRKPKKNTIRNMTIL